MQGRAKPRACQSRQRSTDPPRSLTITAGATTQTFDLTPSGGSINFGDGTTQACAVSPAPAGCASNPIEVNATLNVAAGTPNGTTGNFSIAHTGTPGTSADTTLQTLYVIVVVAGYTFDGFYEPVGGNSTDDPDFYITAKAGQGIALKWNLYDGDDNVITDVSKYTASSTKIACSALDGDGDAIPTADDAGTSDFRYDADGEQTVFVWKTLKNWANTCRTFELKYDSTLVAELDVHFTK
jgi:hypothetical protein